MEATPTKATTIHTGMNRVSDIDVLNLKKGPIAQLLQDARMYANPTNDCRIHAIGIDCLQAGEISLVGKGARIPQWEQTSSVVNEILRKELGLEFIVSVDPGHTGDAYAWVEYRSGDVRLWKGVAPWYIDWYLESGLADQEIQICLAQLVQWQKRANSNTCFRGENALYPDMRSGFARKWATLDPATLELIAKHNLREAKTFARAEGMEGRRRRPMGYNSA